MIIERTEPIPEVLVYDVQNQVCTLTDIGTGDELTFELENEQAADTDPTIDISEMDAATITSTLAARQPLVVPAADGSSGGSDEL